MKGVNMLVDLIIEKFIDKKQEFASVVMIADECNDKWVTEAYVQVRLLEIHREIRKRLPRLSTHLITTYYLANMPDTRRFYGCKIPAESNRDHVAAAEAKRCLAVGNKGVGIRFVPKRSDYFCLYYEKHNLSDKAYGLMKKRARSTTQAVENKQITPRQAAPMLIKAAMSVPAGINGPKNLPREVKEVRDLAVQALTGPMEKTFNKPRKGSWRL